MTKEEILAQLQAGNISVEEASKRLTAAEPKRGSLFCKVSEKGAISIYGLQSRFPVTLYVEQWTRLIEFVPDLKAFMTENDSKLKRKDAAAAAP